MTLSVSPLYVLDEQSPVSSLTRRVGHSHSWLWRTSTLWRVVLLYLRLCLDPFPRSWDLTIVHPWTLYFSSKSFNFNIKNTCVEHLTLYMDGFGSETPPRHPSDLRVHDHNSTSLGVIVALPGHLPPCGTWHLVRQWLLNTIKKEHIRNKRYNGVSLNRLKILKTIRLFTFYHLTIKLT